MGKLIVMSLMLLGCVVSASGQYRVVRLTSSQVQGQGPKADSILVAWDDGKGRHRWSYVSLEGPFKFDTGDVAVVPFPPSPFQFRIQDGRPFGDFIHYYFVPPPEKEGLTAGDTILGHQTILLRGRFTIEAGESTQPGRSAIHYSRELGMELKIVITRDDTVTTSEAVSIDQQANFDLRAVDLSAVEQAAASAEAAGQAEYAKEIRTLIKQWQKAAANWPSKAKGSGSQ